MVLVHTVAFLVASKPKVSLVDLLVQVALVLVWRHWAGSCVLESFQWSSPVDVPLPNLKVFCIHWSPCPSTVPEVSWVKEEEKEVLHPVQEDETRMRGQLSSDHLKWMWKKERRRYLGEKAVSEGGAGLGVGRILSWLVLDPLPPPPFHPQLLLPYPCCQTTPIPLLLLIIRLDLIDL